MRLTVSRKYQTAGFRQYNNKLSGVMNDRGILGKLSVTTEVKSVSCDKGFILFFVGL
jgi:hypothetical protein